MSFPNLHDETEYIVDERDEGFDMDREPDIDPDDELSWDEEAAQDEWVDSAMSYLREQNPEPPF